MKKVYIIDSMTSAYMVSIISQGKPINVIFEQQEVVSDSFFAKLKNFSEKCIMIAKSEDIRTPSRYTIIPHDSGKSIMSAITMLAKLFIFRKKIDAVFKEEQDTIYIGSDSSSLMVSLRTCSDNIHLLYHGFPYLIYDMISNNNGKKQSAFKICKYFIRKSLFKYVLRLPNFVLDNLNNTYSLYKDNLKINKWVNYKNFTSKPCEDELLGIRNKMLGKKNCLYLPLFRIDDSSSLLGDVRNSDLANVDVLKNNLPKDATVYIKFHPSLYDRNESIRTELIKQLKDNDISAVDIGAIIPNCIGGASIPAEVLMKYLPFSMVLSPCSSTVWNVEDDERIISMIDTTFRDETYVHKILPAVKKMKLLSNVNGKKKQTIYV